MIEVIDLAKRFGSVHAVQGVSFSAKKGEVIGFLGPNGAGKTTTLRMLSTFLPPTSGTAKVAGFDIQSEGMEVRRRLGYLPEAPAFYPEMTVRENLSFQASLRGVARVRLREKVDEALQSCGLTEVAGRLCGQLSKGFRQRTGLAQAIVHDPEVIILDEPTSGLDPVQIRDIRALISSLAEERTVLLSTHLLPEVNVVCNRAVILSRGHVVLDLPLNQLGEEEQLEEAFLRSVGAEPTVEPAKMAAGSASAKGGGR